MFLQQETDICYLFSNHLTIADGEKHDGTKTVGNTTTGDFSHRIASFKQTFGFRNKIDGSSWPIIVVYILRASFQLYYHHSGQTSNRFKELNPSSIPKRL